MEGGKEARWGREKLGDAVLRHQPVPWGSLKLGWSFRVVLSWGMGPGLYNSESTYPEKGVWALHAEGYDFSWGKLPASWGEIGPSILGLWGSFWEPEPLNRDVGTGPTNASWVMLSVRPLRLSLFGSWTHVVYLLEEKPCVMIFALECVLHAARRYPILMEYHFWAGVSALPPTDS